MIKTFRNLLASGELDTIRLATNTGETGYFIKNLQIIGQLPGAQTVELVVKVYTRKPDANDGNVDFSDGSLIAVAYLDDSSTTGSPFSHRIIIDNVAVNQDLFVTAIDVSGSNREANYYLELEQIKLNVHEAAVATLKDMRGA
jgi:hypothetical protein